MPHISVKLYPGRTDEQKRLITEAIVKDVTTITGCDKKWVSVAFEEVNPDDWPESVYRPEILDHPERLTKRPGYDPFA